MNFVKHDASLAQKYSAADLAKVSQRQASGSLTGNTRSSTTFESNLKRPSATSSIGRRGWIQFALCNISPSADFNVHLRWVGRSTERRCRSGESSLLGRRDSSIRRVTWLSTRRSPPADEPHNIISVESTNPLKMLIATLAIDLEDQAIIDVDCLTRWPNDAKIGLKLARLIVDSLRSLVADNGYDSAPFRSRLRESGVSPLIKHRLYRPIYHARNDRIAYDRFNQRALVETVNSSIKPSIRETIDTRCWFR